ncbi:MAG: amidohydrolase, partial [Betaproteobacteria bacterium]
MNKARWFVAALAIVSTAAFAQTANFSVISGGKNVGHMIAETKGDTTRIDFDVKNNGRGPTMAETIRSNAQGLPVAWTVKGTTTFGSKVDEHFTQSSTQAGTQAEWLDSTGKGSAAITRQGLYVAQSGSPWAYNIYLHALMNAPGMTLAVLPAGTLRLEKGETLSVSKGAKDTNGAAGKDALDVTRYDLSGIDLLPTSLLVDARGELFAVVSPSFIVIRKGYEAEEERLRKFAADWSTQRLVTMDKKIAHRYATPVRIRNVRVFDPATSALTPPVSVLVMGREIAAVEPLDSPASKGETTIDGAGGTLVAGMYEMHGHLGQGDALLNLMAGITTVRDMGNDNAVLDRLITRIEAGEISGPRVVRSGFIEGKSQYSANNGFVVASQEEALEAVRWYGARGYWQIKIYNSMNPAWVPAMITEAHRLGMRVAGHVPAFATADEMITAGYDEMTHINQFMLGWVMQPGEDTRTLFRLTALKRLPTLDVQGAKVQHTIQMMVDGRKAIDPTLGIHELLLLHRD